MCICYKENKYIKDLCFEITSEKWKEINQGQLLQLLHVIWLFYQTSNLEKRSATLSVLNIHGRSNIIKDIELKHKGLSAPTFNAPMSVTMTLCSYSETTTTFPIIFYNQTIAHHDLLVNCSYHSILLSRYTNRVKVCLFNCNFMCLIEHLLCIDLHKSFIVMKHIKRIVKKHVGMTKHP